MADKVCINDRTYHAIRLAADAVLYSPDYITRLAREHKVSAVRLGRRWFVHIESLKAYASIQQQEQVIRQKQLRQERKLEQQLARPAAVVREPVLRISHYAAASVFGILLLGVVVGSGVATTVGPVANQAAVAELQPAVTNELAPATALRPVFTDPGQEIYIAGNRTVERPSDEAQWVHVRYE